jgi:hypothetical protein
LHGQSIHIRTKSNGTRTIAMTNDPHHARLSKASVHLNAPAFKLCSDQIGGANFFKAQLGVRVNIASK